MSKKNKRRIGGFGVTGSADPDTIRQLRDSAVPNLVAMTAKQKRDRKRKRAAYDIDPTIKAIVEQIARKEDTSASQIAEMFLAYAVRSYLRGEKELQDALTLESRTRSRTPRFYWDLHLPNEWMLALESYFSEAQKTRKWRE